jgi:hypothetical protein
MKCDKPSPFRTAHRASRFLLLLDPPPTISQSRETKGPIFLLRLSMLFTPGSLWTRFASLSSFSCLPDLRSSSSSLSLNASICVAASESKDELSDSHFLLSRALHRLKPCFLPFLRLSGMLRRDLDRNQAALPVRFMCCHLTPAIILLRFAAMSFFTFPSNIPQGKKLFTCLQLQPFFFRKYFKIPDASIDSEWST